MSFTHWTASSCLSSTPCMPSSRRRHSRHMLASLGTIFSPQRQQLIDMWKLDSVCPTRREEKTLLYMVLVFCCPLAQFLFYVLRCSGGIIFGRMQMPFRKCTSSILTFRYFTSYEFITLFPYFVTYSLHFVTS